MMEDVASVIGDIRAVTRVQGEKLDEAHENIADATEHVEMANKELAEKLKKTRTGNKCLIWCVVIAVIAIICVILFGFVLGGDGDTDITIVSDEGDSSST